MSSRRSLLIVGLVVIIAATAYMIARSRRDFWDFEVYRTAGARASAAEPLYRTSDGHYQYKYWPAFAFVMIPFSWVNPEIGKVAWYALSIGLFAAFVRLATRTLPGRRVTVTALVWLTLLFTGKFLVKELVNGQTNALLGVLVLCALSAVQRRDTARAGVLVGLAIFVKPYALLFLPWLAVTHGLRAIAASVAVLIIGLVLPTAWYGWQGNLDLLTAWYHTVVGTTPENLMLAENISFATMWAKWIGPGGVASALALVTTIATLGVAAVIWTLRRRVREPNYLEVSFLLLLIPLISPQGWDYVLLLGVPAYVVLIDRFRAESWPWRTLAIVGIALTSFTIFDLMGRTLYLAAMDTSVVSVGALCLACALVHQRLRAAS